MSRSEAEQFHQRLREHVEAGVWLQIAVPESAFERCEELGRRFAAQLGTRTLDSLHVAVAIELKADVLWTFDERQRKVAQKIGLAV
jgi:predicted nucleic acid-binding protein